MTPPIAFVKELHPVRQQDLVLSLQTLTLCQIPTGIAVFSTNTRLTSLVEDKHCLLQISTHQTLNSKHTFKIGLYLNILIFEGY